MVILENIDIDIVIDKAILQNIDIDKISNRFKFGISNRAIPNPMKIIINATATTSKTIIITIDILMITDHRDNRNNQQNINIIKSRPQKNTQHHNHPF